MTGMTRSESGITFLLGPAGSGKTYRCLEAIRFELKNHPEGPPLLLITPRQATFQMETDLLTTCGIAFGAVLTLLLLLGVVIRLLTSLFPDNSPEADAGLRRAIDEAVSEAYPGARVTRIEFRD